MPSLPQRKLTGARLGDMPRIYLHAIQRGEFWLVRYLEADLKTSVGRMYHYGLHWRLHLAGEKWEADSPLYCGVGSLANPGAWLGSASRPIITFSAAMPSLLRRKLPTRKLKASQCVTEHDSLFLGLATNCPSSPFIVHLDASGLPVIQLLSSIS
jgi:hypothetical protein